MKTRSLGDTGIEVTELGLGTWPLAGPGPVINYGDITEEEAFEVLRSYEEAGGNFIDTARAYNNAENVIGRYFARQGNREKFAISTKSTGGETVESLTRIRTDLETTLRTLGTDKVEIFQLHHPPVEPDLIGRALELMQQLKDEGKIDAVGASIKEANVTEETERLCDYYMSTGMVDVIEVVYSLLRQRNGEVIGRAKKNGIGVIVRTVLESGLLTGVYKPGHVFKGPDHRARYKRENLDFILEKVEELKRLVKPPYRSLPDLALRFSLSHEGVSSVIFGAQNKSEVELNVASLELPEPDPELVANIKKNFGGMTERANFE